MVFIPSRLKPVSGARHMGRKTLKCTFEMSDICIASGLPENLSATGLIVQMSRGPKLTATKEALAKQAEGASAAYKAACEERDAAQKAGAGNAAEAKAAAAEEAAKSKTEAEDELERASETIKTLRDRNTALLAERDAAAKDVEALKKQAKGLSDEYGRLLMQKESLENKLSDYELVFGEGGDMKKAK